MLTEAQKRAQKKWRETHPRKYYEITARNNRAYKERHRDEQLLKNRQYKEVKREFQRFLNILI